jgi:integrase
MPTMHLTDAAIRRLPTPDSGRVEHWDSKTRGLGLRVSASGVRSWVLMTRTLQAGTWRQQRVTLGQYPALSLAEARAKARGAKAEAKAGRDPGALVEAERNALVADSRNTFAAVRAEFLERYRGRQNRRPAPRTLAELQRILSGPDFAPWDARPLASLTRRDALDALDAITGRGAETMANRALAYLRLLFGWSVARGIIEADPCTGIKKPGTETSRDRVLNSAELRAVWLATAAEGQFNAIVRLLLLTGARLNEVARLAWSEVDLDAGLWTLPAERAKNHRAHLVQLPAPALAILEAQREHQAVFAPRPALVFTTTGATPFSGFSNAKKGLDRCILKARTQADPDAGPMPPWRLHDLRRSVATHMAEGLRVPPHVIEATLNHVSGAKAGVAGVYNRALHLDERAAALSAWSDYLLRLVGDPAAAGNVVALHRRRRAG